MPRYFMRDTPLQALEQLMMSQPGQKPRGGGIYSNELLQDAISGEIGSLKDEVKENTVQEVRKALQANIEAIQRATKLLEKQSDTLTSVMKQKIRELEESKNSFFRYEGLKLYLFWGGMVCNILVFLMLLYGMISK